MKFFNSSLLIFSILANAALNGEAKLQKKLLRGNQNKVRILPSSKRYYENDETKIVTEEVVAKLPTQKSIKCKSIKQTAKTLKSIKDQASESLSAGVTGSKNSGYTGSKNSGYTGSKNSGTRYLQTSKGNYEVDVSTDIKEPETENNVQFSDTLVDCITVDDMFYTKMNTPVVITDLLENDNKVDNLVMDSYTLPPNGRLDDNGDGTFLYTPNEDFIGVDSYEYTVTDGVGQSYIGLVSITVGPLNSGPEAIDDIIHILEGTPSTVLPNDIVANDIDPDGDILIIESCTEPANGEVKTNKDGSFTYTPNDGFIGTDTIVCTIIDGNDGMDTSTIDFIVRPQDFARNDVVVTSMNSAVTVNAPGMLENDYSVEDGSLSVVSCAVPSRGTLTYDEDGSFTFKPNTLFIGVQNIGCVISDGLGHTDTSNIIVLVRPPFLGGDNNLVTDEDVPLPLEPDDILTSVGINGDFDVTDCNTPTYGTIIKNPDGSFLYTPEADFHGNDLAECIVTEPTGETAVIVINIEVRPVDDAPTAVDDTYTTIESEPITFNPLENDINPDADEEMVIYYYTQPRNGEIVQNNDGTLTYTPVSNFVGENKSTYTISDGNGGLSTATITFIVTEGEPMVVNDFYTTNKNEEITVDEKDGVLANDKDINDEGIKVKTYTQPENGNVVLADDGSFTFEPTLGFTGVTTFEYVVLGEKSGKTDIGLVTIDVKQTENQPPTANDDRVETTEDTPISFDPTTNDSDPDGDTLVIDRCTDPLNGVVTQKGPTVLEYTPDEGFVGKDSFGYVIVDGNGGEDLAIVTIIVGAAANQGPVAVDDTARTIMNIPVFINVLSNDSDGDGDTLSIGRFTQPTSGTLAKNPDETFVYDPKAGWSGVDMFEYAVVDGNGGTDTATVTITVFPPLIEGVDDKYTTFENTVLQISAPGVLSNDKSAEKVDSFTQPSDGEIVLSENGGFTYTPNPGFSGEDSFQYTAINSNGETTSLTTVQLTVVPVSVPDISDGLIIIDGNSTRKPRSSDCKGDEFVNCTGVESVENIPVEFGHSN